MTFEDGGENKKDSEESWLEFSNLKDPPPPTPNPPCPRGESKTPKKPCAEHSNYHVRVCVAGYSIVGRRFAVLCGTSLALSKSLSRGATILGGEESIWHICRGGPLKWPVHVTNELGDGRLCSCY